MLALSALEPGRQRTEDLHHCSCAAAHQLCPAPAPLILMDVQCANCVHCGCGTQAGDLSKHSETRIKEIEEEIKALDRELVSCCWLLTWRAAALRSNSSDVQLNGSDCCTFS